MLLINHIIQYFQQISIAVKSYQQVLFRVIFKYIIVFPVQYGMTDICLGLAMFERGRNTFDDNFHDYKKQYTTKRNILQGANA